MAKRKPKKVFIYALADPRVKHPIRRFFYVGQTSRSLRLRLTWHCKDAAKRDLPGRACRPSLLHIRALKRVRCRPAIHLLEAVHFERRHQAEIRWIAQLRREGAPLSNRTVGGQGARGYRHSAAALAKMSAAARARWRSPQYRRVLARAMAIRWRSPQYRRAFARELKRRYADPEYLRKLSKTHRRNWKNTKYRSKTVRALRKNWLSAEFRKRHLAGVMRALPGRRKSLKAAWKRGAYRDRAKPPKKK